MGSFSLSKLSDSFRRRLSDTQALRLAQSKSVEHNSSNRSIFDLQTATGPSRPMRRDQSIASSPRSRSRSVSKKEAKILIRQEKTQVILKKMLHILDECGVQLPIALETTVDGALALPNQDIKVHVANSSDCVYLPAAQPKLSLLEDIAMDGDSGSEIDSIYQNVDSEISTPAHGESAFEQKVRNTMSSNYLCTAVESDTPIPHLFAVIIEVGPESASLGSVQVTFESTVSTNWPSADPSSSVPQKETFCIASHTWNLPLEDADYFISNVNSNERTDKHTTSEVLAERTVAYNLSEPRATLKTLPESTLLELKAGLYLFLLPIIIPSNMPATVKSSTGSLVHNLSIETPFENMDLERSIARTSYELPMVRTPPSPDNALADKPIHISRVWNDSLQYIITFPRKHIPLGSEHVINLKVIPMKKNVALKRVKFNILEKTTYLSQDMNKELVNNDKNSNGKDRVIPLCELRTKPKNKSFVFPEPFKEEVIKCADNNLLNACYESNSKSSSKEVIVASPLDINVALPFLTSKADQENQSAPTPEPDRSQARRRSSLARADLDLYPNFTSSPVIGAFETKVSHASSVTNGTGAKKSKLKLNSTQFNTSLGINMDNGSTIKSRALTPDSNFRHIQISHRLQVAFRISCPDSSADDKMHHYEIVIDTPLVLLSSKCKEESLQLPHYEEAVMSQPLPLQEREIEFRIPQYSNNGVSIRQLSNENDVLPSFEEATSSPAFTSRSTSMSSEGVSPLGFPSEPAPAYDQGYFAFRPSLRNARTSHSPLSNEYISSDDELFSNYTHCSTQLSLEDLMLHDGEQYVPRTYLRDPVDLPSLDDFVGGGLKTRC